MEYKKCKVCSGALEEYIEEINLVKCKECGFIFYKVKTEEEQSESLYHDLYNMSPGYQRHSKEAFQIEKERLPPLGYNKRTILNTIFLGDEN